MDANKNHTIYLSDIVAMVKADPATLNKDGNCTNSNTPKTIIYLATNEIIQSQINPETLKKRFLEVPNLLKGLKAGKQERYNGEIRRKNKIP